jgi:hypothetical protein
MKAETYSLLVSPQATSAIGSVERGGTWNKGLLWTVMIGLTFYPIANPVIVS